MFKKLLIASAVTLGLIYGSGNDINSIKRSITGVTNDSARGTTANDSSGWGSGSGY